MNLKTRLGKLEKRINPPEDTVTVRFGIEGGEPGEPFTIPLSMWRAFEKEARESDFWTIKCEND